MVGMEITGTGRKTSTIIFIAVNELFLSCYYIGETILITMIARYGNLIQEIGSLSLRSFVRVLSSIHLQDMPSLARQTAQNEVPYQMQSAEVGTAGSGLTIRGGPRAPKSLYRTTALHMATQHMQASGCLLHLATALESIGA